MEMVKMKHPKSGGEAEVSKEAFEEAWEPLGWVLVKSKSPETLPKENQ